MLSSLLPLLPPLRVFPSPLLANAIAATFSRCVFFIPPCVRHLPPPFFPYHPSVLSTNSPQCWDKGGAVSEEPDRYTASAGPPAGAQPAVLSAPAGPQPQPAVAVAPAQYGLPAGPAPLRLSSLGWRSKRPSGIDPWNAKVTGKTSQTGLTLPGKVDAILSAPFFFFTINYQFYSVATVQPLRCD